MKSQKKSGVFPVSLSASYLKVSNPLLLSFNFNLRLCPYLHFAEHPDGGPHRVRQDRDCAQTGQAGGRTIHQGGPVSASFSDSVSCLSRIRSAVVEPVAVCTVCLPYMYMYVPYMCLCLCLRAQPTLSWQMSARLKHGRGGPLFLSHPATCL